MRIRRFPVSGSRTLRLRFHRRRPTYSGFKIPRAFLGLPLMVVHVQPIGCRLGEAGGGLARVASATGHCERAARLFGAAEVLCEALGYHASDQAGHDKDVASARVGLKQAVFAASRAEGRAMTLEQAIEYALAPGVQ